MLFSLLKTSSKTSLRMISPITSRSMRTRSHVPVRLKASLETRWQSILSAQSERWTRAKADESVPRTEAQHVETPCREAANRIEVKNNNIALSSSANSIMVQDQMVNGNHRQAVFCMGYVGEALLLDPPRPVPASTTSCVWLEKSLVLTITKIKKPIKAVNTCSARAGSVSLPPQYREHQASRTIQDIQPKARVALPTSHVLSPPPNKLKFPQSPRPSKSPAIKGQSEASGISSRGILLLESPPEPPGVARRARNININGPGRPQSTYARTNDQQPQDKDDCQLDPSSCGDAEGA